MIINKLATAIRNLDQLKYFRFYYRQLGLSIPVLLALSAFVALLDGIGLALFIPLFQVAEAGQTEAADLGNLDFVIRFFQWLDIDITVGSILLLLLTLFSIKGIFSYITFYYSVKTRVRFMKKMRVDLVNGLCNLSFPAFVNIDLGRIQNVITAEIGKAGGALLAFLSALQAAIMLAGYITLAFIANFQFALLITVAGILSSFIYRYINKKVETSSLEQSLIGNGLQAKVLESVWNFKYLKATDLISDYRERLKGLVYEAEDLSMKMGKYNAASSALREPVSIALVAAVIFVQVTFFDVSMLGIALSLVLFYRSLTSLLSLHNNWQAFLINSGGIHLVNSLYEEFEAKTESKIQEPVSPLENSLQFEGVSFVYPNNPALILNNISLKIQKNNTVAIVGESGSGKTTIVNMIAGLLLPASGRVLIDNQPLTPTNLKSHRRRIGYITQEPVVFNDSVFNNVTFGGENTAENIK